jgi:hypothetical protein
MMARPENNLPAVAHDGAARYGREDLRGAAGKAMARTAGRKETSRNFRVGSGCP